MNKPNVTYFIECMVVVSFALLTFMAAGCATAEGPALEIGISEQGAFKSLGNGDDIMIEKGNQGGVHLPLALRVAIDKNAILEASMEIADATTLKPFAKTRLPIRFTGEADEEGFRTITGLTAVVPSIDAAAHREVIVTVTVTYKGATTTDQRLVYCLPPME